MRSIACAWLLAASFVVAGPASAAAPAKDDHVALFKNVSGSMKVLRNGAALDATPGMTLFIADRVVAGADGAAGITFKDGTLVTVGHATEVQVRDYVFEPDNAKYGFDLYLARGTAIYSSGKIGKLAPESVKVGTPTATVGVRGTRFIVTAE